MYSFKEKNKAVKLYYKLNNQATKTIKILGYSNRKTLLEWVKLYELNGPFKNIKIEKPKISQDDKDKAIKYYNEHGKNLSQTVRILGYPSRNTLRIWIEEKYPRKKKHCLKGKQTVKYTHEEKKLIAKAAKDDNIYISDIEKATKVSRTSIYKWKKDFFSSDGVFIVKKENKNVNELNKEIKELNEKIKYLQMECDILNKASDILKKDQGINLKILKNKEKVELIYALRNNYQLNVLCSYLEIAKSSYFYNLKILNIDKYKDIKIKIKDIFESNYLCYGYRRIYQVLKKEGIIISEKVIIRLMKELGLTIKKKKKKKYSSYLGEISPAVPNIIKRNFKTDRPNKLWLTDITEFSIRESKVYLSPMIDCFDGSVVSFTIGTSPNKELVNTMLNEAITTLEKDEKPIIHTDRGGHYRWPEWIDIMNNSNLTRSMSKKGCSPDNSACEGFFGRLKNEFFYNKNWNNCSVKEFISKLNNYINWYNNKRIKISLGSLSPMEYRSIYK